MFLCIFKKQFLRFKEKIMELIKKMVSKELSQQLKNLAIIDGLKIYKKIREKYSQETEEDLSKILLGLIVALIFVIQNHVDKDDRKQMVHYIYKFLNENINLEKDESV